MKNQFVRFLGLFLILVAGGKAPAFTAGGSPAQAFGGGAQAGATTAEDIVYAMPAGWIMQPVQAGPEVIAHYVYYRGGIPYCEMYLSSKVLTGPQSLEQAFQEGIETAKPNFPYYQSHGTQRIQVAGLEAIVHDFSYYMAQSAAFKGRVYVMLVNNKMYSFFFNTSSANFAGVQGLFPQVLGSVRVAPKPAVVAQTGGAGGLTGAGGPGGGMTCEEHGLVFELPAGWVPSNDPAGAKYRLPSPAGGQLAALFVFEPDKLSGLSVLFGENAATALDNALNRRKEELFKTFDEYTPVGTTKIKIGGLDALVHDFDFRQSNFRGFYRWYFISVKTKEDTATTKYAPNIHQFSFMSSALEQREALKAQFDAIFASLRLKGAPAPAGQITTAGELTLPAEAAQPQKHPAKKAGSLPQLTGGETAEPGVYVDPKGLVRIPLPAEAQLFRKEGEMTSYHVRNKNAYMQIWSMKSFDEAERMQLVATEDKKQNGDQMRWDVAGRQAIIKLYTGKNISKKDVAVVTAIFPDASLFILVEVPVNDYGAAQEWIEEFIRGVQFVR
jgi:hypothetical protein